MTSPRIVAKRGKWIELPAGVHLWCSCGRSASQPLCDGSHEGTGLQPVPFELSAPAKLKLCLCKHTKRPPYCDNTHHDL